MWVVALYSWVEILNTHRLKHVSLYRSEFRYLELVVAPYDFALYWHASLDYNKNRHIPNGAPHFCEVML